MHMTVRLEPFAQITRHTKEAVRNRHKLGDTPWNDDEFGDTGQRRYSGYHALALVLSEIVIAQGCTVALAGEFLRAQAFVVNLFLDEIENGQTITPRFVLAMQSAVEDDATGASWMPQFLAGMGTLGEVNGAIQDAIQQVGTVREARDGRSKTRIIAGPWIALASIPEAYRLLKQRAEAVGFGIDGRRIYKLEAGE